MSSPEPAIRPESAPDAAPDTAELEIEVLQNIGADPGSSVRRWLWRAVALAAAASVVAGVVWWSARDRNRTQSYTTIASKRADLRATVTATGTVTPLDRVDVGAEISGTVSVVHVDFNDRVTQGQVLCEIDASQHLAAVNQVRAQLRTRRAELASQIASAEEAQLAVQRTRALATRGIVSQEELEAAIATSSRAKAAVDAARANIDLSRAALASAEVALSKTTIRAPIDGVVLSRAVEPGQTVAASFATPVLFILAKDLTKMEVEVEIDEADIGLLEVGQSASFVVDAFPSLSFPAEVRSIHNISTTVDNVVTYDAVLTVANDSLALRPGMTATATITTADRKDALLVPNAALRFTPPSKIAHSGGGPDPTRMFSGQSETRRADNPSEERGAGGPRVWTLRDGELVAIPVKVGLSDGEWTEVVDSQLEAGTELIIDVFEADG